MKKISYRFLLIALIGGLFTASGCKKSDSSNNTTPSVDSGKLYLHLHTNVDTNEVDDYGVTYTTSTGRKVSVNIAQMYISHVQLVREDGSIYEVPGVIVMKRQEQEPYYIGKIPVGIYKSVKFSVGLDSTTNTLTSTSAIVDTPLNHSEMWYGSSAQPGGYIYVNFQGTVDTTTNANGTAADMRPFMFMIGTNAHYQQVSLPDHTPAYTVAKDSITYVHIIIDYNKLFNGVQLNNSMNLMVMTPSANASANANTISNNIPDMFSYEE